MFDAAASEQYVCICELLLHYTKSYCYTVVQNKIFGIFKYYYKDHVIKFLKFFVLFLKGLNCRGANYFTFQMSTLSTCSTVNYVTEIDQNIFKFRNQND